MKVSTNSGRLLSFFLLLTFLTVVGTARVRAERSSATAAFDASICNATVNSGESIQTAVTNAANGQTICVRGGTYSEQIKVLPAKTGLTLIAYDNETPIIDGNKSIPATLPSEETKALVELGGAGTVFDGFEVRFSSARGIDVTADNITVRNSSVHDNWSTGIIVIGGNTTLNGVLIENNRVFNNLRRVKYAPVIYRGMRGSNGGPTDWTFDRGETWDAPFWTGAAADLPESSVNGLSMTFNNDGRTSRVYVGSSRASVTRTGIIGPEYSASGQAINYSGNDILFHNPDTNKWTLFFDGDALGLSSQNPDPVKVIDAFQIESPDPSLCAACAPMLMSFATTVTIPIVITPTVIGPSDLVRFSPTTVDSLGRITSGSFSLYKTATQLGLPADANIDALDRAADGRLLISPTANVMIGSLPVDLEDLAAYDDQGTWSLFFDGDRIPYNPFGDDLSAAWLDAAGNIYISGDPVGGSALSFIKTRDSTARGNRVYNNFGEGLVAGRSSQNITLEDNVAYDNFHANLYLNSTVNPLVRRNLVYCTDDMTYWRKGSTASYGSAPGIQIRDEAFAGQSTPPPLSSGQVIVNNIVIGCTVNFGVSTQRAGGGLNNALVANNTFANARGQSSTGEGVNNIELSGGNDISYANSRFSNNLILQSTPGAILRVQGAIINNPSWSSFTIANNLYSTAPSSPAWPSNESGRVVGDPQLVGPTPLPIVGQAPDPAAYQLTYASPAFDAGQPLAGVTDDFFGQSRAASGPPDIGADELAYESGIIVQQVAVPAGVGQAFAYTTDYAPGGFSLLNGESNHSGPLAAGHYSVAVAPVAGWTTTAACDDDSQISAIHLSPNETVTCTFTSVRETRLIVANTLNPVSDPQSIDFTLTPGESFSLDNGSRTFVVQPGATLALSAAVPDGWRQTAAACDNSAPLNAIVLNTGDWVTCTFAHEKLGRVIVRKATVPAGAEQRFDFTANYDGDGFALGDGESDTSAYLAAGTYAVTETQPAGWIQTGATCDDGSTPNAIHLDVGETVTCTFTNTALPASITIVKQVVGQAPGSDWAYTGSLGAFTLPPAGGQRTFSNLNAGDYPVSETAVIGYSQAVACDSGETGTGSVTVALRPGEDVICTFTNSRTAPGPLATIYLTTNGAGTVRGIAYAPGDILAYDARIDAWSLFFDASDVGIVKPLGDFVLLDDGSILLTTNVRVKLPNAGGALFTLEVQDIARFVPTHLGLTTTGQFEMYFDGSDVALSTAGEKIDALARRADGTLLISVTGAAAVKNGSVTLKAADEDLLAFRPTSLGATTTGAWSLGFDGSTLAGMAVEDVTSAWSAPGTNDLYLTVTNNFTVKGVVGSNRTVLAVTPGGAVSAYWDASSAGFPGLVDGLHIVR